MACRAPPDARTLFKVYWRLLERICDGFYHHRPEFPEQLYSPMLVQHLRARSKGICEAFDLVCCGFMKGNEDRLVDVTCDDDGTGLDSANVDDDERTSLGCPS